MNWMIQKMITPITIYHLLLNNRKLYPVKKKSTARVENMKAINERKKQRKIKQMNEEANVQVNTETATPLIAEPIVDTITNDDKQNESTTAPTTNDDIKTETVVEPSKETTVESEDEKKSSIQVQKEKVVTEERARVLELLKHIDKAHLSTVIEAIESGMSVQETKAKLFDIVSKAENKVNNVVNQLETKVGVAPLNTSVVDVKSKAQMIEEIQNKENMTAYQALMTFNSRHPEMK